MTNDESGYSLMETSIRFDEDGKILEMKGNVNHFLHFSEGIPDFNLFTLLHPELRENIYQEFQLFLQKNTFEHSFYLPFQDDLQEIIIKQLSGNQEYKLLFRNSDSIKIPYSPYFMELMNKIKVGVCVTDKKGFYIDVNQEYCNIYGYEKYELIGKHFTLIIPETHRENAQKTYDAVMDGTIKIPPTHGKLVRKDGAVIDVEFHPQVIENENNIRIQINSVRDISDIKNYQALLIRMQDSAQVGGWELDLATGKNTWTEHIYKIYEVPLDFEVTPENGMSFYDPEHIPILQKAFGEAVEKGKPFDLELKFIAHTGRRKWVRSTCNPIMVGDKVQTLSGTFQDISEQKEREIQLHQLSLLAQHTTNSVVISSPKGEIEWVNHAFTQKTGYKLDEVIGKKPGKILQGEKSNVQTIARIRQNLKLQTPVSETILNYRKNGKSFWNKLDITPVSENKKLTHWIAIQTDITEEVKMKTDLRESEKRYRLIAENTKDLICLHQPDGTYIYVSPSVKNILGFDENDLIGKKPYHFMHPEDLAKAKIKGQNKDIIQNHTQTIKYRFRKKNGSYIWLETLKQVIEDEENNILLQQTSSRDITERYEREQHILKITQRLELATKSAKIGIWDWMIDSDTLIWDEQMAELYGIKLENAPKNYTEWENFIFHEDLQKAKLATQNSTTQGFFDSVFRIVHRATNQIKYIKAFASVIFNEEGKPIRMTGVNTDVTHRKESELALRKSLQNSTNFRNALNSSALISVTDLYGKIVEVNNTFCEVAEYSREELIGQNHRIVNSKYHSVEFWQKMWSSIKKGEYWRGEIRNISKNGKIYWVDTVINLGLPHQNYFLLNYLFSKCKPSDIIKKQYPKAPRDKLAYLCGKKC